RVGVCFRVSPAATAPTRRRVPWSTRRARAQRAASEAILRWVRVGDFPGIEPNEHHATQQFERNNERRTGKALRRRGEKQEAPRTASPEPTWTAAGAGPEPAEPPECRWNLHRAHGSQLPGGAGRGE